MPCSFNGAGVCTPDGTGSPCSRHRAKAPFNGAGVCTPDGTPSTPGLFCALEAFNGAGVCTPDGTRTRRLIAQFLAPSMEPEFALRMEHLRDGRPAPVRYPSMEPEFALRMELFPQNSKGKQALQTAFSSTRTERANLPFHPARGKKKFLYSC